MATIINARDVAIRATSPRLTFDVAQSSINLSTPFTSWNVGGNHRLSKTIDGTVQSGPVLVLHLDSGNYPFQWQIVPIDRTKIYRVKFWARPSSANGGLLYFTLRQFSDEGITPSPSNSGRDPYKPLAVSRIDHETAFGTNTFGEYSFTWALADWQSVTKFVIPEFLDNAGGATGQYWEIKDFIFDEITEAYNAGVTATAATANFTNKPVATISGGAFSYTATGGAAASNVSLGTRSASVTGGTGTLTYLWTISADAADNNGTVWISGGNTSSSLTLNGTVAALGSASRIVTLTVIDSKGLASTTTIAATIISTP